MAQNKLKPNDKTEALLMKSNKTIFPDAQPISLRVGTADIPSTNCARTLGFMIPDVMTLAKYISYIYSLVLVNRADLLQQSGTGGQS